MLRDGCQDAVQVGGAGDNGADVKATDPFGRRWVIQCKHRRAGLAGAAVGTPDLHVLNGTGRPVHKGDVIVLVTNGRFTKPATDFAQSQRLHLVDRHTLATWAAGPRPCGNSCARYHRPADRPRCPDRPASALPARDPGGPLPRADKPAGGNGLLPRLGALQTRPETDPVPPTACNRAPRIPPTGAVMTTRVPDLPFDPWTYR